MLAAYLDLNNEREEHKRGKETKSDKRVGWFNMQKVFLSPP